MPKSSTDEDLTRRLRASVAQNGLNASKAATRMGLERTLVWRALGGRPLTVTSKSLILSRLHLLAEPALTPSSEITAAFATNLLRFLLQAVHLHGAGREDALEHVQPGAAPGKRE